ncbi:MAG: UDP-N-acetylenolpyruvoylglucosamine reductase [Oscillospiraceae bacterium]|nr:MAG: UDP-N-acetylenolpyruvoylglucosamine reductase [Oscillospiraceae bacterium]
MSYETFEKALCTLPETAGRRFFIRHDFPLSRVTSFHIGGNADLAVYPADAEAFAYALDAVVQAGVPYTVIGNGSNTLVRDGGFRGVVFVTTDMRRVTIDGTRLTGGCGVLLGSIGTNASRAGLAGAEFANGIPGTLGGAVYMNAGAYGGQLADIVCETVCYDLDAKQVLHLDNAAQHFGYRHSVFMEKNYIILSATLQLTKDEPDAIRARMNDYLARRREKQPLEYPSAGSVFKRPEGHFAGKLIEDAGLKGLRVGGAEVSPKHAGFIVNVGGATARDVLELIERIREKVYAMSGVTLECEIRTIGED